MNPSPSNGPPQPGYAYLSPPPYSSVCQPSATDLEQQQQQPQVVIVLGAYPPMPPTDAVDQEPIFVSMTGAYILSFIVIWFCGILFGWIALVIAVVGQKSAAAGNTSHAIRLRKASYCVSITGIIAGIIVAAVLAGIFGSMATRSHH